MSKKLTSKNAIHKKQEKERIKQELENKKNKLIYDEVSSILTSDKKTIDIEKIKELDKEQKRINMINDKFKEYNLEITDEETQETFKRLNEQSEWVSLEGCRFHTIFLKVMEFEMIRDNYKEVEIIHTIKETEEKKDVFDDFKKELEEDRIKSEISDNSDNL